MDTNSLARVAGPSRIVGNSRGQPPSGISGAGPEVGPPASKRLPYRFRSWLPPSAEGRGEALPALAPWPPPALRNSSNNPGCVALLVQQLRQEFFTLAFDKSWRNHPSTSLLTDALGVNPLSCSVSERRGACTLPTFTLSTGYSDEQCLRLTWRMDCM